MLFLLLLCHLVAATLVGVVAERVLGARGVAAATAFDGVKPIVDGFDARTAGLIAHLYEEIRQPIGFALSYQATREMQYDGTLPADFGTHE